MTDSTPRLFPDEKAHGYHTKLPHLTIVPWILHYTEPGDIILDGFCGSGMTGVGAQWCGTASLDFRRELEQRRVDNERRIPEWGARRVILGDLSPPATFIAASYDLPFDVDAFTKAARHCANRQPLVRCPASPDRATAGVVQ